MSAAGACSSLALDVLEGRGTCSDSLDDIVCGRPHAGADELGRAGRILAVLPVALLASAVAMAVTGFILVVAFASVAVMMVMGMAVVLLPIVVVMVVAMAFGFVAVMVAVVAMMALSILVAMVMRMGIALSMMVVGMLLRLCLLRGGDVRIFGLLDGLFRIHK